jgi:hypothetical protein
MFGWFKQKAIELYGAARSGRWRAWREAHLRREPVCQACGAADDLEVHHILPVHAGGSELPPPEGMISLCRPCHQTVAHANDWKAWRPDVRRLAETLRSAEVRR